MTTISRMLSMTEQVRNRTMQPMLRRFFGVAVINLLVAAPLAHAIAPPFPDMASSWFGYSASVAYLQQKGAISGYPDGTFRPRATVNRAEFLKLVFRARGAVEPVTDDCFADVHADAWYAPFVCAAKRRGIVSGYRAGSRTVFKPDQPIVFAEAVKMALLAYGSETLPSPGEHWYAPYVEELDRQNILASSSYIPWDPITRERAADLIARFVRHEEERALANRSPGCGKAPADAATALTIDGQQRSFLLTKGSSSTDDPAPLIVAFHGRTNSNEQVRKYFGLDRAAKGYFIAYPAGLPNATGTFSWSASEIRDIAFFDAIVEELGRSYCIDMDRIYVVGHSLGAWMANSVACARGDVVRASATVGGSTTMTICAGPAAAMIINNPKDALSPHGSAEAMRDIRIARNACEQRSERTDPETLSCIQYAGCTQNPVVFCPHTIDRERDGAMYPHLWPPGTGNAMVEFFEALP